MKLIEALKKIKELQKKVEDLRSKIGNHSAYLSHETPTYAAQSEQIREWLQAHSDILKEILRLRVAIQRTNLDVQVEIEIGGHVVRKSIAEWIHRRRDLAKQEEAAWKALTDRGLHEGTMKQSTGSDLEVKIIRCYDPKTRDHKIDVYGSEPLIIDSKLEVVNAVTDLIEV